jgi:TetR/AcrR family transcriptional regulator, cholesterol catabolism regulator
VSDAALESTRPSDRQASRHRRSAARVIRDRLTAALGPDIDPDVIDSLEMLYSGALVRAGMGYASNTEIAQRLEKSARLILS